MKYKRGEYLAKALEDLEQIQNNANFGYRPYGPTCSHVQQYVEKMLKEKIVELGADPRFEHSLGVLLDEVSKLSGVSFSPDLYLMCSTLEEYYFAGRYPTKSKIVFSEELTLEAIDYGNRIVAEIEGICVGGTRRTVNKSPKNVRVQKKGRRFFRRRR